MKRCVEAGDRRQTRKQRADRVARGERLRLVKGRQVGQLIEGCLDARVDHHRRAKPVAAMHDAMTDRLGLAERRAQRLLERNVIDLCPRGW